MRVLDNAMHEVENENNNLEGQGIGDALYDLVMENPLSRYLIRPVFRGVGSVLGYITPNFIKAIPGALSRKIGGVYGSNEFVN